MKIAYILFLILFFATCSYAQVNRKKQVLISMDLAEEYNDNIYLTCKNKKSDFITYISPSLRLLLFSEKDYLDLTYRPTRTLYLKYPENNTWRHEIRIKIWRKLTRHLKLSIDEYYIKSEEPVERIENWISQTIRVTRRVYERNILDTNLEWLFNPHSKFKLGYSYQFLENEDPSYDDTQESKVYLKLRYWLNIKNGIDLDFSYEENRASREIGKASMPDFDGYDLSLSYAHRFNKRTRIALRYRIVKKGFLEKEILDRHIKEYGFYLKHFYSPLTSFSFCFFKFRPYGIGINRSFTGYEFQINRRLKKGNLLVSLSKNWDVGYIEARRRGFTRYKAVRVTFRRRLGKFTTFSESFIYRKNRYYFHIPKADKTYYMTSMLSTMLKRNIFLTISHTYGKRVSPYVWNRYSFNSIMFSVKSVFP